MTKKISVTNLRPIFVKTKKTASRMKLPFFYRYEELKRDPSVFYAKIMLLPSLLPFP
jgi:hypothetical protein